MPTDRDEPKLSDVLSAVDHGPDEADLRFETGSYVIDPGELSDWYNSLSLEELDALADPDAAIEINAHASSLGSAYDNAVLSGERGFSTARALEALGVEARIYVRPHGESRASSRGEPESSDQGRDRAVSLTVHRGELSDEGHATPGAGGRPSAPQPGATYYEIWHDSTFGRLERLDVSDGWKVAAQTTVAVVGAIPYAAGMLAAHFAEEARTIYAIVGGMFGVGPAIEGTGTQEEFEAAIRDFEAAQRGGAPLSDLPDLPATTDPPTPQGAANQLPSEEVEPGQDSRIVNDELSIDLPTYDVEVLENGDRESPGSQPENHDEPTLESFELDEPSSTGVDEDEDDDDDGYSAEY